MNLFFTLWTHNSNRAQKGKVGNNLSSLAAVNSGVPQGSTLGPLLFSMFINDLFNVTTGVAMHAYADDVQLYSSDSLDNLQYLVEKLNNELDKIYVWTRENRLLININKSKVLPICYKKLSPTDIPPIVIGGSQLELVSSIRNLGNILNSKLTCTNHVNLVVSKIYSTLRILRMTASYTPTEIKKNLVLQLIMPHINFFCNIYGQLDSSSESRLKVAFNNAVRYVFSLSRYSHVSLHSDRILGVGIVEYMHVRNLMFLRGILWSKTPSYLYEKLSLCISKRTCYSYCLSLCTSPRVDYSSLVPSGCGMPCLVQSSCFLDCL